MQNSAPCVLFLWKISNFIMTVIQTANLCLLWAKPAQVKSKINLGQAKAEFPPKSESERGFYAYKKCYLLRFGSIPMDRAAADESLDLNVHRQKIPTGLLNSLILRLRRLESINLNLHAFSQE